MKRLKVNLIPFLVCLLVIFSACGVEPDKVSSNQNQVGIVSEFDGKTPYVTLNNNNPQFESDELVTESYEKYSKLDSLGRCGVAMACIGKDIMPTEERGAIGQVKPSGWHTIKYDVVDGKYLYNRCHLIGFQLTGENANEQNLITGTRYMNVEGMLPFENMVADYIRETENHVLYRVTPLFEGEELVARGVKMEAFSVEDNGEGICFNVYIYNNQPGVEIEYLSGESLLSEDIPGQYAYSSKVESKTEKQTEYVININSKKFHIKECGSIKSMKESNKQITNKSRQALIDEGYSPCGSCKP